MNPTPGILYLVDGTVKCAEREKPEKPKGIMWDRCGDLPPIQAQLDKYNKASNHGKIPVRMW